MGDLLVDAAGRIQHVGQDHVDAGRKAFGLASLQLVGQFADHGIAYRIVQQCLFRNGANPHHGGIEIVTSCLEMIGASDQICRYFAWQLGNRAIANDVEHADEASHGMRQRFGTVGIVERQRRRRRNGGQISRLPGAFEPFQRVGTKVNRPVAIRKKAHGSSF
ncbi:hypothetical protein [Polaromonas sp.]|uniref:hypothetical protein n=1 Tax=Polaromonas sp. TaxID=1869339 RepID=UPI0025F792EE|nr:hypothetical protein [Polaromonas sp.]